MKKILILIYAFCICGLLRAQTVQPLTSGTQSSMRGLSVVDDKTVWVSGSNGTVGVSLDSGNNWKWITVKGFEKTDFRDIEAFDSKTAIIMAVDSPAYILKTIDAGENWKVVFEDHTKGMFLDAMEFWDEKTGIVIGDPINGKFFIARTYDSGNTWRPTASIFRPVADSGEACFASSGTNVRALNKSEAVFITGGQKSNMIIRSTKTIIPIIQGKESTGTNSIAVRNSHIMMMVGGDFMQRDSTDKNCVFTNDGGKTWIKPTVPPHGYRSCVEWLADKTWITCGLNGVDYTTDEGKTFTWISKDGYHVCRKAKKGTAVYFAGGGGRIGRLKW